MLSVLKVVELCKSSASSRRLVYVWTLWFRYIIAHWIAFDLIWESKTENSVLSSMMTLSNKIDVLTAAFPLNSVDSMTIKKVFYSVFPGILHLHILLRNVTLAYQTFSLISVAWIAQRLSHLVFVILFPPLVLDEEVSLQDWFDYKVVFVVSTLEKALLHDSELCFIDAN